MHAGKFLMDLVIYFLHIKECGSLESTMSDQCYRKVMFY